MSKTISTGIPIAGMLALLAVPCSAMASDAPSGPAATAAADPAKIERGRYLVTTSACHDCHTPWIDGPNGPEVDMSRMLSGHPESLPIPAMAAMPAPWAVAATASNTAWLGPWGVSFTANLTPDDESGLGKWTFDMFRETIRTGRHKGRGREVLPPMPIVMYRNFTDEDLEAIFSFLKSIPAVSNRVPEPLPPPQELAGTD